jgi:hypothetical protein
MAEAAYVPTALGLRLVEEARRGRLNAWRLGDLPGVGPGNLRALRDGLASLVRVGALRVGDYGRVEVQAENLGVLDGMERQRLRRRQQVRRMAAFARMRRGCRQQAVLRYFGQTLSSGRCEGCDLCRQAARAPLRGPGRFR